MSDLTLYHYNLLSENQKLGILEDSGIYLEIFRRVDSCKVALFRLFDFYVEVYLDEKRDKIIRLNTFNSYARLDLYTRYIDIEPVLECL